MTFDWSAVNTALMIGAIGYLYRQARIVDQVRQALLGMPGQEGGGALAEVKALRAAMHDLRNTVAALQGEMELRRNYRDRATDA